MKEKIISCKISFFNMKILVSFCMLLSEVFVFILKIFQFSLSFCFICCKKHIALFGLKPKVRILPLNWCVSLPWSFCVYVSSPLFLPVIWWNVLICSLRYCFRLRKAILFYLWFCFYFSCFFLEILCIVSLALCFCVSNSYSFYYLCSLSLLSPNFPT